MHEALDDGRDYDCVAAARVRAPHVAGGVEAV